MALLHLMIDFLVVVIEELQNFCLHFERSGFDIGLKLDLDFDFGLDYCHWVGMALVLDSLQIDE